MDNITATKGIYDKMVSEKFIVSMIGLFDQDLLLSLINATDKKLSGMEVQPALKRKIFHFMVECSQNLINLEKSNAAHNNIFLIGQENEGYSVYIGSVISKEKLAHVLDTIKVVNDTDISEIKEKYYNELASAGTTSDEDMLLLSMLNISNKTKQKINYELVEIDSKMSFLSFKVALN